MSKLLVTGSAGFIGSHFVDYALAIGDQVVGVDDLSAGNMDNVNPAARFIRGDVTDYPAMLKLIETERPDGVVHFAADATTKTSAMGWNDPFCDYRINMAGTLNVLEAIRRSNVPAKLVYASSAAVYGEPDSVPISESHPTNPVSPYGVSKLAGEKYCLAYARECGVAVTIFRIFNTFGPRQPRYIMSDLIKKMRATPAAIEVLGTGEQLRDYAYVSDVVRAFHAGMTSREASGKIFNIAGGNQIAVRDLARLIADTLGLKPALNFTGQSWKGDIARLWADTSLIRDRLGWRPEVPLEEGLRRLADWIANAGK